MQGKFHQLLDVFIQWNVSEIIVSIAGAILVQEELG